MFFLNSKKIPVVNTACIVNQHRVIFIVWNAKVLNETEKSVTDANRLAEARVFSVMVGRHNILTLLLLVAAAAMADEPKDSVRTRPQPQSSRLSVNAELTAKLPIPKAVRAESFPRNKSISTSACFLQKLSYLCTHEHYKRSICRYRSCGAIVAVLLLRRVPPTWRLPALPDRSARARQHDLW